eukprot:CAMPEP_0185587944 /NCGR_PEP_ID=MMETSP0434-20130131/51284_1 /TAXON_ID=626734 ORGANISM="Favella taraikaensis, Strain Fe Narragansett Bay" /NCGR_SAMPLE_ID=MMETSP0434 /ASSEMBLY_ACC=CAM_ASM_000379 /LENGTH=32 /DNA_ID= /DNA_START= /DNA_END= /DNA_ORIENTATION=
MNEFEQLKNLYAKRKRSPHGEGARATQFDELA